MNRQIVELATVLKAQLACAAKCTEPWQFVERDEWVALAKLSLKRLERLLYA